MIFNLMWLQLCPGSYYGSDKMFRNLICAHRTTIMGVISSWRLYKNSAHVKRLEKQIDVVYPWYNHSKSGSPVYSGSSSWLVVFCPLRNWLVFSHDTRILHNSLILIIRHPRYLPLSRCCDTYGQSIKPVWILCHSIWQAGDGLPDSVSQGAGAVTSVWLCWRIRLLYTSRTRTPRLSDITSP